MGEFGFFAGKINLCHSANLRNCETATANFCVNLTQKQGFENSQGASCQRAKLNPLTRIFLASCCRTRYETSLRTLGQSVSLGFTPCFRYFFAAQISCCRTIWIAAIFALRKSRNDGVKREFSADFGENLRKFTANFTQKIPRFFDGLERKFAANLGA